MIIISNLHSGTNLSGWLRHFPQRVGVNINSVYYAIFYKFIVLNKKNTGMLTQEGFCFVGGVSFF